MFKTGCLTCKHEMGCGTPCFERVDGVMVFHRHENSDMYKAYLAEKERADKAEATDINAFRQKKENAETIEQLKTFSQEYRLLVEQNERYRQALETLYDYHRKTGGTHYIMMSIREVLEGGEVDGH